MRTQSVPEAPLAAGDAGDPRERVAARGEERRVDPEALGTLANLESEVLGHLVHRLVQSRGRLRARSRPSARGAERSPRPAGRAADAPARRRTPPHAWTSASRPRRRESPWDRRSPARTWSPPLRVRPGARRAGAVRDRTATRAGGRPAQGRRGARRLCRGRRVHEGRAPAGRIDRRTPRACRPLASHRRALICVLGPCLLRSR